MFKDIIDSLRLLWRKRGWHTRIKVDEKHGFLAWCAKTPNLGDGPMDVDFSKEVHFEFGVTAWDALDKLHTSVFGGL